MLKCVNKSNLETAAKKAKGNETRNKSCIFLAKNSWKYVFANYVLEWYQFREKLSSQGLRTCYRNQITRRTHKQEC